MLEEQNHSEHVFGFYLRFREELREMAGFLEPGRGQVRVRGGGIL